MLLRRTVQQRPTNKGEARNACMPAPDAACCPQRSLLRRLLQADVERELVVSGYLLPGFHKAYWMGFNALEWGAWKWVDPTAGRFSNAAYKHWGTDEPNNEPALQLCGAANHSLVYGEAWGWADANCGTKLPFVCKMIPLAPLHSAGTRPAAPSYLSKYTGNMFTLHTTAVPQAEAEAFCVSQASHLASFLSVEEQVRCTCAPCVISPQLVLIPLGAGHHYVCCCGWQASLPSKLRHQLPSVFRVESPCGDVFFLLGPAAQVEVESFFVQSGNLLPGFHKFYWMGLDSNKKDWPTFRWLDRAIPGPVEGTYQHWGKLLPDGVPEPNSQAYCAVANFTTAYGGAAGWCDADCTKTKAIFMCKKQGNAGYYYKASNGNAYIFNASYATFDEAQDVCKLKGAHLVAWTSYKEQVWACNRLERNARAQLHSWLLIS